MSLIDSDAMLQAIVEYMKDNYPTTPEEFNFQAELKVVSHWHWFEDKAVPRRKPSPREDFRIKKAVKKSFQKWSRDLRDQQSTVTNEMTEDLNESSLQSCDEYISGLKEDICAIQMYYNKEELEDDETESEEYSCEQQVTEDEDNTTEIKSTKDNASKGVPNALRRNGELHHKEETLLKGRSGKSVRLKRKNKEEDELQMGPRKKKRKKPTKNKLF